MHASVFRLGLAWGLCRTCESPFAQTSLSSLTDLTEAVDKKPNDAVRFDLLAVWVPDAAARHKVLVENPAMLYDFPAG
jgi:hypothetical protein